MVMRSGNMVVQNDGSLSRLMFILGLENAFKTLLPSAEHRLCVWHMYNNFKKQQSSMILKNKLWAAARATHENHFIAEMNSLKNEDELAYRWLQTHTNPKNWSRAFFSLEPKYDILVNNISECFNKVLLNAREKPILGMLEAIRFYLMDRLQKKREFIDQMKGTLGPKIKKKLEKIKDKSRESIATHAGELKYEIRCINSDQYIVDLRARTCSCRRWQLTGITCSHAVAAISKITEPVETFLHHYYSKDAYVKAYKNILYPINGSDLWEPSNIPPILPPHEMKLLGRPKKSRRKDSDERCDALRKTCADKHKLSRAGSMVYTCRVCHQVGHNARKCPSKVQNQGYESQPIGDTTTENGESPPSIEGSQSTIQLSMESQQTTPLSNRFGGLAKRKRNQRCSLCRQLGHNRTKCTSSIADMFPRTDNKYSFESRGDERLHDEEVARQ